MKGLFISMILLFSLFSATSQTKVSAKSFPTNFNNADFENIEERKGEMIAFDGIIKSIQVSRNKTPFYLLDLGKGKTIWTVLVFENEKNIIGDEIRIIGYLSDIIDKKPAEAFLGDHTEMVMAIGLVDFKKAIFLFAGGADIQRKEWIDGKIPTQ